MLLIMTGENKLCVCLVIHYKLQKSNALQEEQKLVKYYNLNRFEQVLQSGMIGIIILLAIAFVVFGLLYIKIDALIGKKIEKNQIKGNNLA